MFSTLPTAYPLGLLYLMSKSRDHVTGDIGDDADGVAVGKDIAQQRMSVHFDREWTAERDRTAAERLRDIEEFVYGDSRGLRVGLMRQQQWQTIWLVVLSIIVALILLLEVAILWRLAHLPIVQ
jgi:hypothetical protein